MEKAVKPRKKWLLALLAVLCGVAVALAFSLYGAFYDRKVPNFSGTYEFFVRPGMEPSDVVDTLLKSGVVLNRKSLSRTLEPLRSMKVGHYTVDAKSSSKYVSRMLANGWQTPVNLTLSGTIRTPQILARKIGNQMLVDSAAVAEFALSEDSLARYGITPALLFTIVIPDTYQVLWTSSVSEIFDRFKKEADAYWTDQRVELARKQGLTPVGVATLASIVDGETQYGPEQPTVAGVYLNRLRIGMLLSGCSFRPIPPSPIATATASTASSHATWRLTLPIIPTSTQACLRARSPVRRKAAWTPSSTRRTTTTCISAPILPSTVPTASRRPIPNI